VDSPHEPVGLVAAAGAAESVAEPAVGGVMTATVAGVAAAVGVVIVAAAAEPAAGVVGVAAAGFAGAAPLVGVVGGRVFFSFRKKTTGPPVNHEKLRYIPILPLTRCLQKNYNSALADMVSVNI